MANNGRIQLLRGSNSAIGNSTGKLNKGQPIYNYDKNYLTIGDRTNNKNVNDFPITVREVRGWYDDWNGISASMPNTIGDYYIKPSVNFVTIGALNKLNLSVSYGNTGGDLISLSRNDSGAKISVYAPIVSNTSIKSDLEILTPTLYVDAVAVKSSESNSKININSLTTFNRGLETTSITATSITTSNILCSSTSTFEELITGTITNSNNVKNTIGGRNISDIFYGSTNSVRHAIKADEATKARFA